MHKELYHRDYLEQPEEVVEELDEQEVPFASWSVTLWESVEEELEGEDVGDEGGSQRARDVEELVRVDVLYDTVTGRRRDGNVETC